MLDNASWNEERAAAMAVESAFSVEVAEHGEGIFREWSRYLYRGMAFDVAKRVQAERSGRTCRVIKWPERLEIVQNCTCVRCEGA